MTDQPDYDIALPVLEAIVGREHASAALRRIKAQRANEALTAAIQEWTTSPMTPRALDGLAAAARQWLDVIDQVLGDIGELRARTDALLEIFERQRKFLTSGYFDQELWDALTADMQAGVAAFLTAVHPALARLSGQG